MTQTVGEFLQSRIHKSFTVAGDDLYALGYLSTSERIALSGLIGDSLEAFAEALKGDGLAEAASREIADEHLAILLKSLKDDEEAGAERGRVMKARKALLPLAARDRAWDGGAAVGRLRDWAGGPDKDTIDWGKYKVGFAWVEPAGDEGYKFGDFHLPFADVIDGEPHAVFKGCAAVVGALNGARGEMDIPEEDREKAYNLMARYYEAFDEDVPALKSDAHLAFKFTLPIVKYYVQKAEDGTERHFVEGAASDVSQDLQGDRMAERTIVKFVEYVALDDPPIGMDVEHSEAWTDQIGKAVEAAVLYEVPDGLPGEPPVFWVKFEVDQEMSHGRDLVAALKAGKRLGLSIAGDIIEYHVEESGVRVLDHVRLYKIAVTKQPANRNTWLRHMTKSLGGDGLPDGGSPEQARKGDAMTDDMDAGADGMEDVPGWLDYEKMVLEGDLYATMQAMWEVSWNIMYSDRPDKKELFDKAVGLFQERVKRMMDEMAALAKSNEELGAALEKVSKALGLVPDGDGVEHVTKSLLAYAERQAAGGDAEPSADAPETAQKADCGCNGAGDEPAADNESDAGDGPEAGDGDPTAEVSKDVDPDPGDAPEAGMDVAGVVKAAITNVRDDLEKTVLQAAKLAVQEGLAGVRDDVAALAAKVGEQGDLLEKARQEVEVLKAQPMGRKGLNPNASLGDGPHGDEDLDVAIAKALEKGRVAEARRLAWKKWGRQ